MKISLQHKLMGAFIAAVLLLLVSIAVGLPPLIRTYFITSKEHELMTKGKELVQIVNDYYDGQLTQRQLYLFVNHIDSFLDSRVWIIDKDLKLITVSEEQAPDTPAPNRRPIRESPMHHFMNPSMRPDMMGPMMAEHHNRRGPLNQHQPLPPQTPAPMPQLSPQTTPEPPAAFKPTDAPLSLSDITGMDNIIKLIQDHSGETWSISYYHPYYEENMLMVGIPLIKSDGTVNGTVLIHTPLADIDFFLKHIYLYLLLTALVACLLALLLANFLSLQIIRPLKAMRSTAAAMAAGNYNSKITNLPRDEVGDLGKSLNSLSQALSASLDQLAKMDRVRRDFVANISHELRTPLTIIRGYNEALLDGTVTDPSLITRYQQLIRSETTRLEKLIAELLDLSRLQSEEISWTPEPVNIGEVAVNVLFLLEQQAAQKNVKLISAIAPDLPLILAEGDRLTQLILILLDNAVKYSPPESEISLEVFTAANTVCLKISDQGHGIAPADLPYIWDRFYKGDKSRTRSGASGGTGLGLAIAKAILDRHGATAEISSEIGHGTTFTIYFPKK
ncbi:MAG: ATP-binding protein [Sporomusaceae bacterium]|nr:ATP-binding protein [Sporomusaceae bacterium]